MLLNRLIQLKYYYLSLPPKQQKRKAKKKSKTLVNREKKTPEKNSNSVYLYTNKILKPIHKHQSSVRFQ